MATFSTNPRHPSNWNRDERNLYAKVFTAIFSDAEWTKSFLQVRNRLQQVLPDTVGVAEDLSGLFAADEKLVVSFDNNLHDIVRAETDAGEYCDVAVWNQKGNTLLTIKAKANTDWSFCADILLEIERVEGIQASQAIDHAGHCLVVAEKKWQAVSNAKARRQKGSQLNRLCDWLERNAATDGGTIIPTFVLTWEDIAEAIGTVGTPAAKEFRQWLKQQASICLLNANQMPPRK